MRTAQSGGPGGGARGLGQRVCHEGRGHRLPHAQPRSAGGAPCTASPGAMCFDARCPSTSRTASTRCSVEIFSKNNALLVSRQLKFLQRLAYLSIWSSTLSSPSSSSRTTCSRRCPSSPTSSSLPRLTPPSSATYCSSPSHS
jgi:hypothetical protein